MERSAPLADDYHINCGARDSYRAHTNAFLNGTMRRANCLVCGVFFALGYLNTPGDPPLGGKHRPNILKGEAPSTRDTG